MVRGSQTPNCKCVERKGEKILKFEVNLTAYSCSKWGCQWWRNRLNLYASSWEYEIGMKNVKEANSFEKGMIMTKYDTFLCKKLWHIYMQRTMTSCYARIYDKLLCHFMTKWVNQKWGKWKARKEEGKLEKMREAKKEEEKWEREKWGGINNYFHS